MRTPKRLLLLSCAAGLAVSGSDLSTDYGRVRTLRVSSELELDLETTAVEMKIDDEPSGEPGPGGTSSSLVRRAVLVEHVLEGAGGKPKRSKRTFETLHDATTFSFGEDERSDEHQYPLQGVTLELVLDEEGTVRCELTAGPKPGDDELLEGHELALSLDGFLPEDAVELETSWELDDAACKRALATALDARLFAEPPPDEGPRGGEGERGGRRGGRGRGGAGRSLGFLVWGGKAKLVALDEEHGGLPCARITLELQGSGTVPESSFRGPPRGFFFEAADAATGLEGRPFEGTVEAELKGELFISMDQRRPVALKLDGELRTENRFERERDGRRFSMHSEQSGRLTLTLEIEEERP